MRTAEIGSCIFILSSPTSSHGKHMEAERGISEGMFQNLKAQFKISGLIMRLSET